MIRKTESATTIVNFGHALTFLSLWSVPGLYDLGMLTMMNSKKDLKNLYVKRYGDAPPEFDQTGDAAYLQGWAMKVGAVLSIFAVAKITGEPVLAAFSFSLLWLGGTIKHFEAARMLYDQSSNYRDGILDESPPVMGEKGPDRNNGGVVHLSLAF